MKLEFVTGEDQYVLVDVDDLVCVSGVGAMLRNMNQFMGMDAECVADLQLVKLNVLHTNPEAAKLILDEIFGPVGQEYNGKYSQLLAKYGRKKRGELSGAQEEYAEYDRITSLIEKLAEFVTKLGKKYRGDIQIYQTGRTKGAEWVDRIATEIDTEKNKIGLTEIPNLNDMKE